MKDADRLGYDGRYKRLESVIDRTFNVPLMTQIVVGSAWSGWTAEQRDKVMQAFRRFIVATYARRFDGYSGETIRVDGTRPANGGTLVMTEIVRTNDEPVTLNYQTRLNAAGVSQVVDIFLTGTISELATRRSEFTAVLQHDGYSGLLAALERKASNQAVP
jgi:phospholipid transport system substrate-binding protein